jgi:phospholipid transport system substrate-binding protein|tara:strand:+ start:796 stop:1434 length:639 start_codon:yes stop_codon:yes gene_type:complete
MMRLGLFITIICLAFGLGSLASAQSSSGVVNSQQNPFENIEAMTGRLLIIIDEHKDGYPANEDAYFEALNTLMTGFVDFDFVAKKVMGRYAKSSSKEQRVRFETAFRQGLVETYGRGLMSYGNEKIVLINKQALAEKQRRVIAKQEIRSEAAVYPLQYLMYQKKATGEWNVVNVTLNGIDLSKTFASQFLNASRKSSGNIDQVIENWLSGPK